MKSHELRGEDSKCLKKSKKPLNKERASVFQEYLNPQSSGVLILLPFFTKVLRTGVMVHLIQVFRVETFVLSCKSK